MSRNFIIFAVGNPGRLTEWPGSGLQNRVRRFDSATDLSKIPQARSAGGFLFSDRMLPAAMRDENKNTILRAADEGF